MGQLTKPNYAIAPLTELARQFNEYIRDYTERSILFMDVMHKRGNQMVSMTTNNSATVLNFEYKVILDGAKFERPINYWLAEMQPPEGVKVDHKKRPYVVQDPRAGQGPGIGGFKKDSEIGDALRNGHPVYFIGFNSEPVDGQTYEDIIREQVKFYEHVAELHPDSPKMCAIGNCAAGYLTMFSAMQRPELFGPILIAGSPLSYWNGERGRYPMRYKGGLIGGSWANSFLGDLGGGKFDGTYLILNFDLLNPANFLWTKQYDLFANIDKESNRYLQFEKWWGDFIQFNTEEIKWLVDKLFIGNELTTGHLTTSDGILLDPRKITSPIITFISDGDNISPPPQSAGWIADLYHDEQEIIAAGKTIIYCLNRKVGHLAIFTATKVGKREDEMFVENMDTIDMLPPGLYELVLETPEGAEINQPLQSRYIPRTINDIKALGYNSVEDDRAFATVAKVSEVNSFLYSTFIHPWFKMVDNPQYASFAKSFRPLRQSYTVFADSFNPWMKLFEPLAIRVNEGRNPADDNNKFLQLQNQYAEIVTSYLESWQELRDNIQEQAFFSVWGNPWVQKFWGTSDKPSRYTPSLTQLNRDELNSRHKAEILKHIKVNNKVEALFRFVSLVIHDDNSLSEKTARILLSEGRKLEHGFDDHKLKNIIRMQSMVVDYDSRLALAELSKYSFSSGDFDQVVAAVKDIAQQVGGLPADVGQTVRKLASQLNVKK